VDLVEWIWSGGVTNDAVVVRAKLARDSRTVRVAVSDSPLMANPRYSEVLAADDDLNGRVISARISGLRPDTHYFYAVEADGRLDRSRQGRVRTFGDGPFSFSVALGSCARVGSNGAVYDAIRALDPDLFLVMGDFFYGDIQVNRPERYQADFDRTLTAPAQAALYRSVPVAYTWDDHDYGANNAGEAAPGRAAALRTYREYVPHYPLPAGPDSGPIYQAFTIGRVRLEHDGGGPEGVVQAGAARRVPPVSAGRVGKLRAVDRGTRGGWRRLGRLHNGAERAGRLHRRQPHPRPADAQRRCAHAGD
jgi:phosphodiesterase/alkaline phosphatase D-like protein